MTNYRSSNQLLAIGCITLLLFALSFLGPSEFQQLTANPDIWKNREYWRWISCNFVHFGWVHSLMNLAGFLLISLGFFYFFPTGKFLLLMLFCSLVVGNSIFLLSPEISQYAGLSGTLHGLIIAGCFYSTTFSLWKRFMVFALVVIKIIDEQFFGHSVNPLNQLMPASVAVDAHLLGALAGLCFVFLDKITLLLLSNTDRKKESA
jgi:rhomboid family GlyGly-CTERM serine protease